MACIPNARLEEQTKCYVCGAALPCENKMCEFILAMHERVWELEKKYLPGLDDEDVTRPAAGPWIAVAGGPPPESVSLLARYRPRDPFVVLTYWDGSWWNSNTDEVPVPDYWARIHEPEDR